jgi:hypothetical protein
MVKRGQVKLRVMASPAYQQVLALELPTTVRTMASPKLSTLREVAEAVLLCRLGLLGYFPRKALMRYASKVSRSKISQSMDVTSLNSMIMSQFSLTLKKMPGRPKRGYKMTSTAAYEYALPQPLSRPMC